MPLNTQYLMYIVGALRLNLPQPVAPYTGTVNATTFGNQCIQLPGSTNLTVPHQDEDCLNVNVIVPANVTARSKLPVVVVSGGVCIVVRNALTSTLCSGYTEVRMPCPRTVMHIVEL